MHPRDARQRHALPILNAFELWLKKEFILVLPKAAIAEAFRYTINQWAALCRYTEDGCLDIDNNTAERMVKLPAIGRKNWRAPDVPRRTSGRSPPRNALLTMFILNRGCLGQPLYLRGKLMRRVTSSAKEQPRQSGTQVKSQSRSSPAR
jgi:hypothetical protein